MPIPQNKSELQAAIKNTYGKLKADLENIDPVQSQLVEMPGHQKDLSLIHISEPTRPY